jgi:hypothetical protein
VANLLPLTPQPTGLLDVGAFDQFRQEQHSCAAVEGLRFTSPT